MTTLGYNAFGELTHQRSPSGNLTTFAYDRAGRMTERRDPVIVSGGQTLAPVERYEYNTAGDRTAVVDAANRRTEFAYDNAGNLITQTDPPLETDHRRTVQNFYDQAGQLVRTDGPIQEKSPRYATPSQEFYNYDGLGRMVEQRIAADTVGQHASKGTVTTYHEYDDAGRLTQSQLAFKTTPYVRYGYNGAGEKIRETLASGNSKNFGYDLRGRVLTSTDGGGRRTTNDYDPAGRLISTTRTGYQGGVPLDPRVQLFTVDAAGNVLTAKDPRGAITSYDYDTASRLTKIVQPADGTTSVTSTTGYDAEGNQTRITDGRGNTTWRAFDAWGNLTTETEPSTARHPAVADRQWTYSYDITGRPVREVHPGGTTVTPTWDAWDRITQVEASSTDPTKVPNATRSFTYDDADRLTSVNLPQSRQTFSWRTDGQLFRAAGALGAVERVYGTDGLLARQTDQAGTKFYEYDANQWLTKITSNATTYPNRLTDLTYEIGYDATGIPTSSRWSTPDGGVQQYTSISLDPHGAPAEISVWDRFVDENDTPRATITYENDANGNVTNKAVANRAGTTGLTASGGEYTYDLMNRLTGWTPQNGDPAVSWTWDNANNRTSEAVSGGASTTWTYDQRNLPVTAQEGPVATTYETSANGNLTGIDRAGSTPRDLRFDAFDRLVSDGPVSYAYDGLDRLVRRTGSADQNLGYGGLDREPTVIDTAGGTAPGMVAMRTPDERLVAMADYSGRIGDPFNASAFSGLRTPIIDGHTDVVGWRSLTGDVGTAPITSGVGFAPFGRISSGTPQTFGFQSDFSDPSTGATWMDARWYEPSIGGFLSRDTADLGFTGSESLNRYGYGNGNPVSMSDPTGHFAFLAFLVPALAFAFAAATVTYATQVSIDPATGVAIDNAGRVIYDGAKVAAGWAWNQAKNAFVYNPSSPMVVSGGRSAAAATTTTTSARPGTVQSQPTQYTPSPQAIAPSTPRVITKPPPPPPPYIVATWTTTRVVAAGSTTSAGVSGGYRVVTTRWWADKYTTDHTRWSDGRHNWSAEDYIGRVVTDSSVVRTRTVDPERVTAKVPGAVDYSAAGIGEYTNAVLTGGACGLTATISSCAGQGIKQVVGGNCAPISFAQGGCVIGEPRPGTPGGIRESAATNTALNEATGNDPTESSGILGPLSAGGNQPCKPTPADPDCDDEMLGTDGTQITSKTLTPPDRPWRIDVENPAPGKRPGQLHLQTKGGGKYLYDFKKGEFVGLPKSLARTLKKDPAFGNAIRKGRNALGVK